MPVTSSLSDTLSDPVDLTSARILITGASGFLGRHLLQRLLGLGAVPHLLARPARVDALRAGAGPCPVLPAALEDPATLRQALHDVGPEIVFHLGAYTSPVRDPGAADAAIAVNYTATVALAGAAMETGVARFITTGTSEEYGRQAAPFAEDLPERPLSPYSASKAAASLWLRMLADTHDFPMVLLRPFLVYGPGQAPPKLVPAAILAAVAGEDFPMTSGTQMRELTYVGDVVEGLLAAATRPEAPGGVFNLGSGDERTVLSIVEEIYRLANGPGRPLPGAVPDRGNDMQRYCADTTRAARRLGWQATTPLEDGLRATIDWARAHGDTPVPFLV